MEVRVYLWWPASNAIPSTHYWPISDSSKWIAIKGVPFNQWNAKMLKALESQVRIFDKEKSKDVRTCVRIRSTMDMPLEVGQGEMAGIEVKRRSKNFVMNAVSIEALQKIKLGENKEMEEKEDTELSRVPLSLQGSGNHNSSEIQWQKIRDKLPEEIGIKFEEILGKIKEAGLSLGLKFDNKPMDFHTLVLGAVKRHLQSFEDENNC
ncbi:hypothetical protein BVC80_1317g17 [Macleaya cordata]|uniref:DUF4283 domain-containing protein n=1 Tax=Macleaya cordata TaxID=56857 RepID=A0A200QYY0_MACCD|nr:hypothetical protein BVC80_1317g17 [Macleaya cordata]